MRRPRSISLRVATVLSIAMLGATLAVPAAAPVVASTTACTDPPAVFPIGQVVSGQTAQGWTVLQGTTPEPFDVTLLGVLRDAIAPGRDVILVKASGPNIDAIGGMGPGFSGSPVYRDGQLVGSVSYGLGGDAHYGALTPGQDLVDVLLESNARVASTHRILLSRATRRLIALDAGERLRDVSPSLSQIPLPLATPAVTDERIKDVTARFAARGVSVTPYSAGSSSASATIDATHPIEPGGVFTAAMSYGAIAWAAIATATITCGDEVVAFGHSFTHGGSRSSMGAVLDGTIVTTIPAGNDFNPFKMGNIGTLHGVLDQDRLAGVRGVIGVMPTLTEVTSSITNLDTGRVSDATTQIAHRQWTAGIASDHVYYTLHAALDADRGISRVAWTIVVRWRGQQFEMGSHHMYDGGRVIWGPASDIYSSLRTIQQEYGAAHIVSVSVTATVTEGR